MIKRCMILAVAVLILTTGPRAVFAADAVKPAKSRRGSLKKWFGYWRAALKKKAVQARYRRGVRATAVAAVRGSKQSEADPKLPYWKGTWTDKKSGERLKEREEQSAAIDLILEGKFAEAEKALDAFEKAHPKSGYLADIQEARGKLEELKEVMAPPEEKKAEPAEEKKAEPAKEKETKKPEPEEDD